MINNTAALQSLVALSTNWQSNNPHFYISNTRCI